RRPPESRVAEPRFRGRGWLLARPLHRLADEEPVGAHSAGGAQERVHTTEDLVHVPRAAVVPVIVRLIAHDPLLVDDDHVVALAVESLNVAAGADRGDEEQRI